MLFSDGQPHDHLAPQAAEYLQGKEIDIEVNVGAGGSGRATMYTCDLSAEYVKINAEYRTQCVQLKQAKQASAKSESSGDAAWDRVICRLRVLNVD